MANERYVLQVYVGLLSPEYEALSIEASKQTTAEEIVECISEKLGIKEGNCFELAEVRGEEGSDNFRERRISPNEHPVRIQLLWPKPNNKLLKNSLNDLDNENLNRFYLRKKQMQCMNWSFSWTDSNDSQLLKDYFLRFLYQPKDKEYPDLCQLPDLTEQTLLENLKARFDKGHIYTYVGSILIALNPFKFLPIYNPKYVQHYQNRRLGEMPPHIFAIADAAYQAMLRKRYNQCIVISGESGSGKTESTNLLLHHLTALSQKGTHGTGVEQTILGAGPVLEAFGNAKTKHNNNSSRFGKFIQVNYKENGMVHGAVVQKYLLEKSRIVSQAKNERNYHVFYYLIAGATDEEKEELYLTKPQDYTYLNHSKCYTLDGVDESYEYSRLKQSLEMVGFTNEKHKRLNSVLSAVLHLGNVEFTKKSTYHCDEAVMVKNQTEVSIISKLLMVKEETLMSALTCKRTKAAKGETIIINYKTADAVATRDAMAKCLYGALFEWIVMQVNQALLIKKDVRDHKGNYIGVLDIFGFEDFGDQNYFEQFCINFANEHLHHYFNQHVFKYEQEEYQREDINWTSIDFHDNIACLQLIEGRPQGLLCLLDDQCNFPGASNQTVLQKFVNHHKNSCLFEVPPCRQSAFVIKHYAGKVKYQIKEFREKNLDLMRPDIVCLLKSSSSAFVRELVGSDPLSIFRWQILKAFFKAYFIFTKLREESKKRRASVDNSSTNIINPVKKYGFESKNIIENEARVAIKKSSHPSIASNSAFQRFHNSIINNNNNNNNNSNNNNNNSSIINNQSQQRKIPMMQLKSSPQCIRASNSLKNSSSSVCQVHGSDTKLCSNEAAVLQKAHKIIQKNKLNRPPSFKSKGIEKSIKNLQTLKAIVGKSSVVQPLGSRTGRKQTPTVTFQFQQSLNQLMETLNQANPFFIRCIKSNSQKTPNKFDDMLVLVQLRYTGMLETVRIRQSGYSVRLTFEEFIQHYRILLLKGLLSSRNDIKEFLERMNLNQLNYQMGKTKVFMRESEKLALDDILHQEILRRIITLQRWVRTWITYHKFNRLRNAVLIIQKHVRRWLAQQRLMQLRWINNYEQWAAVTIQKAWKSFKDRNTFVKFRNATINFQARVRGFLSRQRFKERLASFHKPRSSVTSTVTTSTNSPLINTTSAKHITLVNSNKYKKNNKDFSLKENHLIEGIKEISHEDQNRFNNLTNTNTNTSNNSHYNLTKDTSKKLYNINNVLDEDFDKDNKSNTDIILNKQQPPPPLPPRRQSQNVISNLETESLSEDGLIEEKEDEDFESSRLDRRRNKPFRKLSIKRSKSSKLQSVGSMPEESNIYELDKVIKSPSETDIIHSKTHDFNNLTEFNSYSKSSTFNQSLYDQINQPNELIQQHPQQFIQPNQQKNAFQKAKKHFKTLIIGSSSKTERKSKENLIDIENVSNNIPQSDDLPMINYVNSSQLRKNENVNTVPNLNQNRNSCSGFNHAVGHNLISYLNCSKSDICSVCENNIAQGSSSYNNGLKCSDCDLLFHNNCSSSSVQIPCVSKKSVDFYTNSTFSETFSNSADNSLFMDLPSQSNKTDNKSLTISYAKNTSFNTQFNPSRPPRNKYRTKPTKLATSQNNVPSTNTRLSNKRDSTKYDYTNNSSSWSVTRTAEFTDPRDILITDVTELHYMEIFIGNKICEMESTKKKPSKESTIDVIFKNALREFKSNLISTYSVASQDGRLHITYKCLIEHFEQVVTNVCQKENTWKSFPVIMGVNAFRGYLDEFRNLGNKLNSEDKPKIEKHGKGIKRKRGKKKVIREDIIEKCGHKFHAVTANIPTVCEVCQSLTWLMEKIWVCKECKLTCHKKCISKINTSCRNWFKMTKKGIFGVQLENLVNDNHQVPVILEKLITAIEFKGLYTEGIYRKSGTTSKINELKQKLDNLNDNDIELDSYSVHVLTAALKSFFREMPEPLMTFELYDDFLWVTAISDTQEKVQALFTHINKLPRANYDVLERLIFHLARVAQHENANRMNANSLAIVFAPCVLRTNKPMQMQDKLSDISKQTIVLECIINERLRQVRDTLADIDILDTACHTASSRLSSLRLSKLHLNRENTVQIRNQNEVEDEEAILAQQIKHLRTEKALLTNMLPSFRLTGSDEDLLSNADLEGSMIHEFDDLLPSPTKNMNFKFGKTVLSTYINDIPNLTSNDNNLRHLTKDRVTGPQKRRLPSKFNNKNCKTSSASNQNLNKINLKELPKGKSEKLNNKDNVKREVLRINEKSVRV